LARNGQPRRSRRAHARAPGTGRSLARPGRANVELAPADLRWHCPPVVHSGRLPSAAFLLDQDRPMRALRTGLSIHAPGYHLVVSGLIGSGRTVVVQNLLRDIQATCPPGPDRVLVHNLRERHRPMLISLKPGGAATFREELKDLGRTLHDALHGALRARPHRTSRRVVVRASEARERRIMAALQRQAHKMGCALMRFQGEGGTASADIYPLVDGEAVSPDALPALVSSSKLKPADRERLLRARDELVERLQEVSDRVHEEQRRLKRELREMDRRQAWRVMQTLFQNFRARWEGADVADWLDAAGEHVERHLGEWVQQHDSAGEDGDGPGEPPVLAAGPPEFAAQILKTVLSDVCPVISETNPTWNNLFGTIEEPAEDRPPGPERVHAGALLRADGGYLIVRAADVLREPGVWSQLKRTLQTGRLEIRSFDQSSGGPGGVLQPDAVPIDLKVVLIAEPGVYETLAEEDPQFPQIFKVHAEFDGTIPANKQNLVRYADYLYWLTGQEHLHEVTPDAAAAVAEYGARSAGRRDRLITRFTEIADLVREASHLCERAGGGKVTRDHVEAAVRGKRYRHDLQQELVERDYASGYMRLSTSGMVVGQVNSLTVLSTGTLEFGRPCRITANAGAAAPSRSGLINIEGEVQLSGPIHDKGVKILGGYLLQEFGGVGPLCMQATICFEQLYNGVEGDSASLAQCLALMSSLAEVPLEQGLGITGSINQKGEVQAVGSVNEKIEGFYRLCRARRLTGKQGVVIPRANVGDLMLDQTVVQAVEDGEFHVYAVEDLNQAIELMAQMPADQVRERVREKLLKYRHLAGSLD
jgi:lon-related putative ATP-dependent protease